VAYDFAFSGDFI